MNPGILEMARLNKQAFQSSCGATRGGLWKVLETEESWDLRLGSWILVTQPLVGLVR